MAKNKRFWSLLILLLSVASIRRKLLKNDTIHTNSESCNIQLGSQKKNNLIPNLNHSDITTNNHQ